MALLDDVADLLTTGGITTTIYRGNLVETPSDAIGLQETGGISPVRAMSTGPGKAVFERPTFQIIRRSTSYDTARTEMTTILSLLDGLSQRTINSTRYAYIEATQSPFSLGRDDSDRAMLALNFSAVRTTQ